MTHKHENCRPREAHEWPEFPPEMLDWIDKAAGCCLSPRGNDVEDSARTIVHKVAQLTMARIEPIAAKRQRKWVNQESRDARQAAVAQAEMVVELAEKTGEGISLCYRDEFWRIVSAAVGQKSEKIVLNGGVGSE